MRPLGQFLSGVIAEFVGINAVLIGSGIMTVVVFGLIYFLTPVRGLDSIIQKVMTKANGTKDDAEGVIGQETVEISIEETEQKPQLIQASDMKPAIEATK